MDERKRHTRVEVEEIGHDGKSAATFFIQKALNGGVTESGESMRIIISDLKASTSPDPTEDELIELGDWEIKVTRL